MTPAITAPVVVQQGNSYYLYVGDGFQLDAFDVTRFQYGEGLFLNGTAAGGFFGAASATVFYKDPDTGVITRQNSTTANNVDVEGNVGNETWAPLIYSRWLGHQDYSSAVYVNDLQGPKIYVGDDVFSITVIDADDGTPLSAYGTAGPVFGTGVVYNDMFYIGAQDGYLYAFKNPTPVQDFTVSAAQNKGSVMWNNETLIIRGRLFATETYYTDPEGNPTNLGIYSSATLPNATIILSVSKDFVTVQNLTTTTDNAGYFEFSFNPTTVGQWQWVALFEGECLPWISYNQAYSEFHTVDVTVP